MGPALQSSPRLNVLRRETLFRRKEEEIAVMLEQRLAIAAEPEILFSAEQVTDDQLRMMFACCYAALSMELQVALSLKTLCGFSVGEIARAFLLPEETIAKRLTRAKQRLREAAVPFDSVLQVLYLLFNEGYNETTENLPSGLWL